jgi:hypothetical protein
MTKLKSPAPDVMDDWGRWINPFRNDMTYEQMIELEKYQAKVERQLNRELINHMEEGLF